MPVSLATNLLLNEILSHIYPKQNSMRHETHALHMFSIQSHFIIIFVRGVELSNVFCRLDMYLLTILAFN